MPFKKLIASVLARSPLPLITRRAHRRQLSILMFHGFASGPLLPYENLEHKHLEVAKWRAFAGWLARVYRVIPLSEAVDCLVSGKSLPDYAVCVTMDDGFRSTHDLAFPVLKELAMPASIYLATSFVEEKRPIWVDRVSYSLIQAGQGYADLRRVKSRLKCQPQDQIEQAVAEIERQTGHAMPLSVNDPSLPATQRSLDWDQIIAMRDSGLVEFGSHTCTHRIVGRCSRDVAFEELFNSRRLIEERIGGRCDLFCYPNGTPGDFTPESEALAREAGYRSTLTTVAGWNAANASPFALRRLGVNNELNLTRFQLTVSGVMARIEGYGA